MSPEPARPEPSRSPDDESGPAERSGGESRPRTGPASSAARSHPDGASGSPGEAAATAGDEASSDGDADLDERLETLVQRHVVQRNAEIHGLFEILGSRRRLFLVNFMAGLSRGVGFFLGVTLVGGLLIGAMAVTFDFTVKKLGFEELTFRRVMEVFAKKAVEAQEVWRSVREEEGEGAGPIASPGSTGGEGSTAPPREPDDGGGDSDAASEDGR